MPKMIYIISCLWIFYTNLIMFYSFGDIHHLVYYYTCTKLLINCINDLMTYIFLRKLFDITCHVLGTRTECPFRNAANLELGPNLQNRYLSAALNCYMLTVIIQMHRK